MDDSNREREVQGKKEVGRRSFKDFAKTLRVEQTDAEGKLWRAIRSRRLAGFKFPRQHPVEPYVIDFYCHEAKMAIELDGGQHNTLPGRQYDSARTEYLARQGIGVLRFWNDAVLKSSR